MNRNAHGVWLEGERPDPGTGPDPADSEAATATIRLPEGTPDWNNSTIFLERIHDALVANGWGLGPS